MVSISTNLEIDPNLSIRMETPRASSDLDPESRVSYNGDRSPTPSPCPSPSPRFRFSDPISLYIHGFDTGDMVWGKVKSHPWWPGHIFNEAFASPSVRRTRCEGHVLVAFFGDSSYGWFDPSELVHFAPTFLEKSKQTAARSFVKAVEESVDESSRRAALGLSCMCRNPYNFRSTNVPGYFAVDVPGYERGGIYSKKRIEKAREAFAPEVSLSFLQGLALVPTSAEPRDVEMIKKIAQFLALRKATYEEFDETYAQAFGVQAVRPPQDNLENEPEKFAPRVAPLSGPLVIAEPLGSKKKTSFHKPSSSSSSTKKKNKYLLKRRDECPVSNSLPQPLFILPSGETPTPDFDNYVLQKREPHSINDDEDRTADWKPKPLSPPPLPLSYTEKPPETTMPMLPSTEAAAPAPFLAEHKPPPMSAELSQPNKELVVFVDEKAKKKKIKKHPREDFGDNGEELRRKKKKRKNKEEQGSMAFRLKKLAMGIEDAEPEPAKTLDTTGTAGSAPKFDLTGIELPELLADLSNLAMDPFYGVERDAASIVLQVFLKFRSLVYQKSLVLPLASEGDDQEFHSRKSSTVAPPPLKERKEKRENPPKVKLGSLFKRSSDPTKAGRKRTPSDRQEEIAAKRSKKLDQLKSSLSNGKTAALTQITPQGQKDNNAASTSANSTLSVAAAADSERQELLLPLPQKKVSPTNLILKFPPRSTLPSIANLKARFARFGPLVVERCRVIWNTHSCRVQFRYKVDALEAYNFVRDNNLFGQIPVRYSVKEVEMPGVQCEPERQQLESQPQSSLQFRPGNGTTTQARPPGPLKSILKKPGEDVGKENQRVKFKLAGDDSNSESPSSSAVAVSISDIPVPLAKSTTFVPPPSLQPPKPTNFLPPQRSTTLLPQSLPRPMLPQSLSLPSCSFEAQQLHDLLLNSPLPPPLRVFENRPPVAQFSESHLQQQVQYGGCAGEEVFGGCAGKEGNTVNNVDVSHKMLSILLRCSDIVATLQSLPGFVIYRPL